MANNCATCFCHGKCAVLIYCRFLFMTGQRRTCPPGDGCTVKVGRKVKWRKKKGSVNNDLIDNGVTIPVRCKDCKHYKIRTGECLCDDIYRNMGYEGYFYPEEDFFCGYGERSKSND